MLNVDVKGTAPPVVSSEALSSACTVVIVDGDLDLATAPQLESHITARIAEGHRQLVVDLSGATFLDSTAMATLLLAIAPLRDDPAAAVVLAGAGGVVDRALTVSGIGALFQGFATRAAAIESLALAAEPPVDGWRAVRRRPRA